MAELWIPQTDKHPDVSNLFDMMLVFQEHIDEVENRDTKIARARQALSALSLSLTKLDEAEKQISLSTGFAIFDSTEEWGKGTILTDVGMSGMIDDIHGVSLGERLPLALSLGVDVVSIHPIHDPMVTDYVMTNAKAPIGKIHYIETSAA